MKKSRTFPIIICNEHSHTFQNVLSPDESCSGGLAGRGAGSVQASSGKVYFISINLAGRLDDYYPHVVCYRRLCSAPSLSSTGSLPWRGARSRGPSCSWWAWPPCSWPPRWKKSSRQHALSTSCAGSSRLATWTCCSTAWPSMPSSSPSSRTTLCQCQGPSWTPLSFACLMLLEPKVSVQHTFYYHRSGRAYKRKSSGGGAALAAARQERRSRGEKFLKL